MEKGEKIAIKLFSTEDARIEDIAAGKVPYRIKLIIETAETLTCWTLTPWAGNSNLLK